jgi:peptidoglycan hydrolase CwlO-like protein
MGLQENAKIQKDIEELKKQIWLLTLKIKNLRESTNKIKRLLNSTELPQAVGEESLPRGSKSGNNLNL